MLQSIDDKNEQQPRPRGPANRSLEELEHNWALLRWRLDLAMEERRLALDGDAKRHVNRGNFTIGDTRDLSAGEFRKVTNGVLAPPLK